MFLGEVAGAARERRRMREAGLRSDFVGKGTWKGILSPSPLLLPLVSCRLGYRRQGAGGSRHGMVVILCSLLLFRTGF